MKKIKKCLSFILAFVLLLLSTVSVVAETSEEVTGFSAEEETDVTLLEEFEKLATVRAQLKQFFDEKKAAGEHAFIQAYVCEFEESFDENYDVVWIIYYWTDRDEVVSAVNAFLQENGIDQDLVAYMENEGAAEDPALSETDALVKAKFEAKYSKEIAESEYGYLCNVLYANTDENGELEWALCRGSINGVAEVFGYDKLSKVFLTTGDAEPFGTEFAVYDAKKDDFVLMDEDLSAYRSLEEKMVKLGIAYPIGDADYDRELTIYDATIIQRYLAGLNNKKIDEFLCYVDDDDEISILDATVIQCYLTKLCNIDGSKPYSE